MASLPMPQTQVRQIRPSLPSLPDALNAPLAEAMTTSFAFLTVLDDIQAAPLPMLINQFEYSLRGSDEEEIELEIGKMALLYPNGKLTPAESDARIEIYIELLRDLPFDCLAHGFRQAVKASRFFPTVAEIREHADAMLRERKAKIFALSQLLLKHQREWRAPVADKDICSPAEAASIMAKLECLGAAA
jgi:hypothetical protein